MSLVVNHNLMAANTARNLNAHYSRLATSTQRLSSGLRVNSAADDAAGLAIRELQRADIAALQQGARNANDAISMIQVADGALGIIDEKLIRMKELAEQAATGTYDSTQRLMIESEYQAMASEITRIANATDFNGMKLLDGTLDGDHDGSQMTATGKMKIHFGTGNDSAEDYYYITVGDCTAQAFGVGNASTWEDVQSRATKAFEQSLREQIKASDLTDADKGKMLAALRNQYEADGTTIETPGLVDYFDAMVSKATEPTVAYANWGTTGDPTTAPFPTNVEENPDDVGFLEVGKNWPGNANTLANFLAKGDPANLPAADAETYFNDELRETEQQKLKYAWGQAAIYNLTHPKMDTNQTPPVMDPDFVHGLTAADGTANLATTLDTNQDFDMATFIGTLETDDQATATSIIANALTAAYDKVKNMDFAGHTIETQEDAQMALEAINNAIVEKDKIRAHLGAVQNRLENTVSNLNIQAENLQAAESRISDVDVATEMTQFVRNQILTQSAVAMLGQANSLPQMAMQLIGG